MNPEEAREARLEWRRARAAKVREDRIISVYLKEKHPGIYNDAASFYNELNRKYPNKYDLRKVKEFKALLTGNPPEPQGKRREKTFPNIPVQSTITDNLELRIPLLSVQSTVQSPPATPVQSPVQSPPATPVQSPPTTPVQSPVQSPPATPVQLPPTTPVQSPVQSPPATPVQLPPTTPVQLPVQLPPPAIEKEDLVHITALDDDMLNKIVCDLQNDPFIHDFFQDMDIDELSPLEAELLLW